MNDVQFVKPAETPSQTNSQTKTSGQKSRSAGRPAKLTREQVLQAAMALLKEGQGAAFSIRQLADRLQTVPGNLYTYFPNKEALLDALAERALSALQIEINDTLPWELCLKQWLEGLRRTLKNQPELMFLIGMAGTAPSTLRLLDSMARLIASSGVERASAVQHAQGLLWTVMGFTLFELQASDPKVVQQLRQAGDHDQYRNVMQHLAVEQFENLWQSTLQRNVDGLFFAGKTI